MNYSYYTFDLSDDPKNGIVKDIDNVENNDVSSYMLKEGVSLNGTFPNNCTLQFDSDGGELVTDFIENIDELVLLASSAQKIFQKHIESEDKIEYLPFNLLNKKGKPVADTPFYIANSIYTISDSIDFDAIKEKAVEYGITDNGKSRFGGIYYTSPDQDEIDDFTVICLKEDKLPEDAQFFRIGELPNYIVIRSDLVEALREAHMTNLNLIPCGERL